MLALWLTLSVLELAPVEPRKGGPSPGETVPDFKAQTVDRHSFSLADAVASHKVVVFVFFSVSCPYSNLFADHVGALSGQYRDRGVLFVGVNSNQGETPEEAAAYAREHALRFPCLKDKGARVAEILGAEVTPEAFLVDSKGRLRYRGQVRSRKGKPYLEEALREVLADRPVRTPSAPAFGCPIDPDRGPADGQE